MKTVVKSVEWSECDFFICTMLNGKEIGCMIVNAEDAQIAIDNGAIDNR